MKGQAFIYHTIDQLIVVADLFICQSRYVLKSHDLGLTWSSPADGNLTDTLLEGKDGISMMQFGEGQGVVLPSTGELLVCGWFKEKGREPGEQDTTDSVACLSSLNGSHWAIKGRLPPPPLSPAAPAAMHAPSPTAP